MCCARYMSSVYRLCYMLQPQRFKPGFSHRGGTPLPVLLPSSAHSLTRRHPSRPIPRPAPSFYNLHAAAIQTHMRQNSVCLSHHAHIRVNTQPPWNMYNRRQFAAGMWELQKTACAYRGPNGTRPPHQHQPPKSVSYPATATQLASR